MTSKKLAFVANGTEESTRVLNQLLAIYPNTPVDAADIIIALGGDGFLLETAHRYLTLQSPIYGVNCGHVGFLMNDYQPENFINRVETAELVSLKLLHMTAWPLKGSSVTALAINEVSLMRGSCQAAKIRIEVDGVQRLPELMSDGVLLATPAGSTAYNLSVHGPILPLQAHLLALTPISAFRPRRWRGALLMDTAKIVIDVLEPERRPVNVAADFTEVQYVQKVEIAADPSIQLKLLFDRDHHLEERILKEQFAS